MRRRWMQRAAEGWKAFRMAWAGGGWNRWCAAAALPGSAFDYEAAAGSVLLNGAVSICLGWIADNFPEAELRVCCRDRGGNPDPVWNHPLVELVDSPNPFYDGDALWAATAMSYAAHGNAYWIKARGAEGYGRPVELWYVPHWQVEPRWPADGSEFISHYLYRAGGREHVLPREDVVHFRFGIDPDNPRIGLSRMRPVLREVVTDNEAATFTAAMLRNMGIPGVLISPAPAVGEIGASTAEELRNQFRARYSGERRGEVMIPTYPITLQKLSLSPEEMALDRIRQVPEDRICAALRISPMVVGLTAGAIHKTYANYREARRAAYEDCLMPMQRRFARTLESQLLPDLVSRPEELTVGWDYTRVAALREDLTEIYRRNSAGVAGGWMKVSEARAKAGLPSDPGEDVYLRR